MRNGTGKINFQSKIANGTERRFIYSVHATRGGKLSLPSHVLRWRLNFSYRNNNLLIDIFGGYNDFYVEIELDEKIGGELEKQTHFIVSLYAVW